MAASALIFRTKFPPPSPPRFALKAESSAAQVEAFGPGARSNHSCLSSGAPASSSFTMRAISGTIPVPREERSIQVPKAFGCAAAASLMLIAGTAGAQPQPMSMVLTCTGQMKTYQKVGTSTTTTVVPGVDPGIGSQGHRSAHMAATATTKTQETPEYGFVSTPARLSVMVEGAVVKVRRSAGDGWTVLTDVVIADDEIRGRGPGGLLGKPKLVVDRRTGDATYGNFNGACEKAADATEPRKF